MVNMALYIFYISTILAFIFIAYKALEVKLNKSFVFSRVIQSADRIVVSIYKRVLDGIGSFWTNFLKFIFKTLPKLTLELAETITLHLERFSRDTSVRIRGARSNVGNGASNGGNSHSENV